MFLYDLESVFAMIVAMVNVAIVFWQTFNDIINLIGSWKMLSYESKGGVGVKGLTEKRGRSQVFIRHIYFEISNKYWFAVDMFIN